MRHEKWDRSIFELLSFDPVRRRNNGTVPLFIVLLSSTWAEAHGLHLSVHVEGKSIVGRAYYDGELPAKKAMVRVETPDGERVVEFLTNDSGRFRQPMAYRADYTVIVETADLHQAKATLKESDFPDDMQSLKVDPTYKRHVEKTIQEQFANTDDIHQIREQLDRIETAIRLRDILGGVGIIVGVLAIVYLVKQQWK